MAKKNQNEQPESGMEAESLPEGAEEFNPNEGGELIDPNQPTLTLTMQQGTLQVNRLLTLDAAEELARDLLVWAARAKAEAAVAEAGEESGDDS